jgi:hypothetical protein
MRPLAILCLMLACSAAQAGSLFQPDPNAVQRYGQGYRYPQAGWIVLHIEGEPYERGVQHGRLLAPEIAAHIRCMGAVFSHKSPEDGWKQARTLVNALFLRGYAKEYLEEMKGIADGASAAGARFAGRRLDLTDVVALNAWPEVETLDYGLEAAPTGLEGLRFGLRNPKSKLPPKPMHCSAFAATGPATKDGKVVFGHITMFSLYPSNYYNVWLDVKPTSGHRVLMQSFPGGIHSGMDYYLNDAGILISETTIAQTRFDVKGLPLASRIRQTMQYADTIEKAVAILEKGNNGLYTNEWLLADVKTNEIAMFELGTHKTKLWRSSKDEWYGGTKGFYWGCNNTKDLDVRLETLASTSGRPAGGLFVPSNRDLKWLKLYDEHKGKMDAAFGKLAFTTPPVCAYSSLDAKFTTTDMAKDLQSWALFGPPMGRTWQPTFEERTRYPEVKPLVSNPWTILHGGPPPHPTLSPAGGEGRVRGDATKKAVALDLHDPEKDRLAGPPQNRPDLETTPAWHGTILPKAEADVWLAASFAACERLAARENAMKKSRKDAKLTAADLDRLAVARHAFRAQYEVGSRAGKGVPLGKITRSLRDDGWHRVAQGKGVLMLLALREKLGAEAFDKAMDEFGTANAGKEVTTPQFREHLAKVDKSLDAFFSTWLDGTGLPEGASVGGPFTVHSFYPEVEDALIVHGTSDEEAVNREAANDLRELLRRSGANVTVPVKSDREVTEEDLKSHHLLLVGRPATNRVSERFRGQLPVAFGPQSVQVRSDVYAHAETGLAAAAENPLARRYSLVVVAGLSARATREAVRHFGQRRATGEVVVFAAGKAPRPLVVAKK